jgi:hypothetical protein
MKKLLISLTIIIGLFSCQQNVPEIQRDEIIGAWDCLTGCEAETYEFYKSDDQYGFYIYSGRRMYRFGTWDLDKNIISLYYEGEDTVTFPVTFRNDSLIFGTDEMVFIPSIPYEPDRVDGQAGIENPVEDLYHLDFTDPEPAEFDWIVTADSSGYSEPVTIEGFAVRTLVELNGDYSPLGESIGIIVEHIEMYGYKEDVNNVSEITGGFIRDKDVILISSESDPENPVGEADVVVYFGRLE